MNAPATAAALAKPTLQLVQIASIVPSGTHIQELRRARFDKKVLEELADSIRQVGVLQPPVARPKGEKFELVCGERRFLAAKQAGLKEISVNVRELTDEQVLEVQLIENLQREGLHELEEAEGYEELMKLKGIGADDVGTLVGKSKSYVYARIKLLALAPAIRKDFYAGKLDASTALEIARIAQHDRQAEAWKDVLQQQGYGDLKNFREIRDHIRDNYMLRLKSAPFDITDEKLVAKAGSCNKCPKRTGNQPDLFGDAKNADVCTDTKCFNEKKLAAEAKTLATYKDKGIKVLVGDDAKRVLPWGDHSAAGGYTLASDKCWDDPKQRKVGDLVDEKNLVLVKSPHSGKMVKVATTGAIAAALNAKGIKTRAQKAATQAPKKEKPSIEAALEDQLPEGFEEIDELVSFRCMELLYKKLGGALGKSELRLIVGELACNLDAIGDFQTGMIAKVLGWKEHSAFSQSGSSKLPDAAKLNAKDLGKLALMLVAGAAIYNKGHPMFPVLKKLGADRSAMEKTVRAELKKKLAEANKAKADAAKKKTAAAGKALAKQLKKDAATKGETAWPFPTGSKAPAGKAAKKKSPAKKAKGKKK